MVKRSISDYEKKHNQLLKKIKELEEEQKILKKAAAYFEETK